MTERGWEACREPDEMLAFLRDGRASDRKFRLFIVACYAWTDALGPTDPRRELMRAFEDRADGAGSREAVVAAREGITSNDWEFDSATRLEDAYLAVLAASHDSALADGHYAAYGKSKEGRDTAAEEEARQEAEGAALRKQTACLRDLLGPLPFRPVSLPPSVLAWNDGLVAKLAASIYEERSLPEGTLDGVRLGVLADALEDAGCTEEELLLHFRRQGHSHWRGCWGIDVILGRG